jgi:superfamily II DNA or RNA helicase
VRDLHIKRGDYRMDEASDMLSTAKLVGDIVDNWCVHAPMKRTIVFATDIAHSLYIQEYFTQSGIYAEHIDGETPKNQRREILERHRAGDFPVLTNVGIATEGYDDPAIECVVLARPTRSFGLYLQMSGRGLRPNPATGKNCLILLDHAQTYREHGSPAEPVVWTLDPEGPAAKVDRKAKGSTIDTSWRCDFCHFVNDYGRYCGCCGQRRTTVAVTPEVAPGRLVEVTGKAGRRTTKSDKEKYWNECLWTCINKGWKVKRAAGMYKSRFGVWPRGFAEMPRGKAEWQLPAKNFHQKHLTRSVNG